jgi:hypothetical protein
VLRHWGGAFVVMLLGMLTQSNLVNKDRVSFVICDRASLSQ